MKVLIIRLSAMGDVIMTVPVIKAFADQNPEVQIAVLTKTNFNPFFKDLKSVTLINPDLKGRHKGIFGLFKLFRNIQTTFKPEKIIDLHGVLRSNILRFFFTLSGVKNAVIKKGRKAKRKLVRKQHKKRVPLKHTTERYAETFRRAGFEFYFEFPHSNRLPEAINSDKIKIGFAPFAMHQQKQYPLMQTKHLIKLLLDKGYEISILGGGLTEKTIAENLEKEFKNVKSIIGKYSLETEIEYIKTLDVMISMDSSNMHLAALCGVKTVSIWGATHPNAGFTPITSENKLYIVQNESLSCRPCSIYGKKPCYKKNMECMTSITPYQIYESVELALNS
jgi:ADP-heptose:LPS heptosyltransferase